MNLDLLALAVLCVVGVAGGVLLRRRLGAANETTPYCGACGTVADALESFTCPACGKDVRELGLLVGRRDPVRRFWRVVGYTIALVAVASGATLAAEQMF